MEHFQFIAIGYKQNKSKYTREIHLFHNWHINMPPLDEHIIGEKTKAQTHTHASTHAHTHYFWKVVIVNAEHNFKYTSYANEWL